MKYICAVCDVEFDQGWSEEEAEAELAKIFPEFEKADCDLVCADCYRKMGFTN